MILRREWRMAARLLATFDADGEMKRRYEYLEVDVPGKFWSEKSARAHAEGFKVFCFARSGDLWETRVYKTAA